MNILKYKSKIIAVIMGSVSIYYLFHFVKAVFFPLYYTGLVYYIFFIALIIFYTIMFLTAVIYFIGRLNVIRMTSRIILLNGVINLGLVFMFWIFTRNIKVMPNAMDIYCSILAEVWRLIIISCVSGVLYLALRMDKYSGSEESVSGKPPESWAGNW